MRLSAVQQWIARIHRHQVIFGNDLARTNVQRVVFLGAFIAPLSLIHVVVFAQFEPATNNEAQWRLGIISFHGTLLVLVSLLAALIRFTHPSPLRDRLLNYSALAIVLVSGIVVTLVDQQVTSAITPFVIACMLAGTLFLLSPFQSLLVYGSALVMYLVSLDYWQPDPVVLMASRMNGVTASGLAFGLSFILWNQAVQSRRQRQLIQTQHQTLQQANARLSALAAIDELTGLTNRRMLTLLLEQELAAIKRNHTTACLLILDLDHFKDINDQHGHLQGDNILKQFAQLLKSSARASDPVCRWGGEEFAILLRNSDVPTARQVAESLRQRISNHRFQLDDQTVTITASIGITQLDPNEPDALMQAYDRADQMLYEAKEAGRNQIRATRIAPP